MPKTWRYSFCLIMSYRTEQWEQNPTYDGDIVHDKFIYSFIKKRATQWKTQKLIMALMLVN
jgi:hypothetical protein